MNGRGGGGCDQGSEYVRTRPRRSHGCRRRVQDVRVDERAEAGGVIEACQSCFYICPIGAQDSAVRKRSDQIFKHVVSATLEPLGFTLTRADQVEQSGTITTQIIEGLLESDLVIADLTDHNPNVFYELAIRHAATKPFIQLIADGQTLPFDIQGLRTIFLDHRDLDSVHNAKVSLCGMVESIRSGKPVETPLTFTLNLQALKKSGDSEARGIADILSEIEGLKRTIRHLTPGVLTGIRAPSFDARDIIAVFSSFVKELATEGRITADDLRRLKNKFDSGPGITTLRKMNQELQDEPLF